VDWVGLIRLRIEKVMDSCEGGNETLGYIKSGKFL
jgi:hypothetical protein